jgi:hypothetical protein
MMKHKWIVSAICLFITTLSLTSFAEDSNARRRNGNWWINQSTDFKLSYVVGFLDGMELGNDFSYWDLLISSDIKKKQCSSYAVDSYTTYSHKYMSKVTDGKIVAGLNAFYADSKNGRILVPNAVWLVVNGIAGTPPEELDTMIESWRNNSQN